VLSAGGSGARAGVELVAYWPARLHGAPRLEGTGLRRLRTRPAWGGLYVVASATGGDWTLRVSPEAGAGSPAGALAE
jgi:hypothetical protein